ncbi:hypothetical protein [Rhizobium straminoryzae]|uniref:Uncharacterized protein n=1 Tax=Rhizobium straminoryzae TaxID=1387186 RepID=A0A549TG32_9HYPH|nr:hypothetical protein [Rhizobium straminoryzae]TRL41544.1 hypothetical protein FNA46_03905 [Rhizobium straminoryzae]
MPYFLRITSALVADDSPVRGAFLERMRHENPRLYGVSAQRPDMSEESRRIIVERVIARLDRHGMSLDTDPRFLALIEGWVSGSLSMSEVRAGFLAQLQDRQAAVRLRYRSVMSPRHGAISAGNEKGRSTLAGSALSDLDGIERAAEPQQEAIDTGDGR